MYKIKSSQGTKSSLHSVQNQVFTGYKIKSSQCTKSSLHNVQNQVFTVYKIKSSQCTKSSLHSVRNQVFTVYKTPKTNLHGFETHECSIRLTYQPVHTLLNVLIFTAISEDETLPQTCVEAVTIPMTSLVSQYISTGRFCSSWVRQIGYPAIRNSRISLPRKFHDTV